MKSFNAGFKALLPLGLGVFPFGAIVGTVCSEANLSLFQTLTMNFIVFAGASQLAVIDLMKTHSSLMVILVTGLIINLRFLLYSAAFSPFVQNSRWPMKVLTSFFLTDQSYAVVSAHEKYFETKYDAIIFYLGTAACTFLIWQSGVITGFSFGQVAPKSWSLDFAVPLSFITLIIPSLKTKKHIYVAIFSTVTSIVLYQIPFKLGLILTALSGLGLAYFFTKKQKSYDQ